MSAYHILCWSRFYQDTRDGLQWTPDNWDCKLRTMREGSKGRCPDADACLSLLEEHGENTPHRAHLEYIAGLMARGAITKARIK